MTPCTKRLRVGSVSYLNPVPLIWGMMHGPQREQVDLSFSLPSVCARELEAGQLDIGLAPVAEIARQSLQIIPGLGITCLGAVRSILLISKMPFGRIRTLAADSGSRTSVQLARVILRERYGSKPEITSSEPVLERMLATSDAALVIGDAALRIEPGQLPYRCLDLGVEWQLLTGLPMVFAAWAAKTSISLPAVEAITRGSYTFGAARIDEIVEREHGARGIGRELAKEYLTRNIRYSLGEKEERGLETFLALAELPAPLLAGRA